MKLYEIGQNYAELLKMIEDDEIPKEAINDTLESLNIEFNEKADNIACIIKKLNFEINALKKEAETLQKRAVSKQKNVGRLIDYLKDQMIRIGKTTIETSRNKLQIRKNPISIEVDEEFIHWAQKEADDLLNYKITPNKEKIKQNIKSGLEYPHIRAVQKENLKII